MDVEYLYDPHGKRIGRLTTDSTAHNTGHPMMIDLTQADIDQRKAINHVADQLTLLAARVDHLSEKLEFLNTTLSPVVKAVSNIENAFESFASTVERIEELVKSVNAELKSL